MTDQELRNQMLQKLYEQRHNSNGGLVVLPAGLNMPDVGEQILANILGQLKGQGLVRWQRVAGGLCRGAANITVKGVEEIESLHNVVIPPIELAGPQMQTAHPTHTLIAWLTFFIGIIFIATGIAFVFLGAKGNTAFTFLGNTFNSENVGIVAVAFGFILVALTFRRLLKSVERLK